MSSLQADVGMIFGSSPSKDAVKVNCAQLMRLSTRVYGITVACSLRVLYFINDEEAVNDAFGWSLKENRPCVKCNAMLLHLSESSIVSFALINRPSRLFCGRYLGTVCALYSL